MITFWLPVFAQPNRQVTSFHWIGTVRLNVFSKRLTFHLIKYTLLYAEDQPRFTSDSLIKICTKPLDHIGIITGEHIQRQIIRMCSKKIINFQVDSLLTLVVVDFGQAPDYLAPGVDHFYPSWASRSWYRYRRVRNPLISCERINLAWVVRLLRPIKFDRKH